MPFPKIFRLLLPILAGLLLILSLLAWFTAAQAHTPQQITAAPQANPDQFFGLEDLPLVITPTGVLANDLDPDGDLLTSTLLTAPLTGSLVLALDGSFTYTPALNSNGVFTFTYLASDGVFTATAGVTLTLLPVNDAPFALPDSFSTLEDTPLVMPAPGVLANDSDPDGDPLTAALLTSPDSGALALAADGSFTYTPTLDASGVFTFTYFASDGVLTATRAVTLSIIPVNDAPLAAADVYTGVEDSALSLLEPGVLGNDSDPDGDRLTAALLAPPGAGSLAFAPDGSFTYTPTLNASGVYTFTYLASDSTLTSTASVTLTILPVNDPPLAAADAYTTTEDTPLAVPAPGLLTNDSDPDGDPLVAALHTPPTSGALSLAPDGSFAFTPTLDSTGVVTFTYLLSDGILTATAGVSLTLLPVNDPPLALDDAFGGLENSPLLVAAPGVLANDTDPDGDMLAASLLIAPGSGILHFSPDGGFIYTPTLNFNGTVTFTYAISDGLLSAGAVVTLTISNTNDPPQPVNDFGRTNEDVPAAMNLVANDSDPNGNLDPASLAILTPPIHGALTLQPTNPGIVLFTPAPDYFGADGFTYQVCDLLDLCASASVTLMIDPVNDPPSAGSDQVETDEDLPLLINPLANDSAGPPNENPALVILAVSTPAHGAAELQTEQTILFTPAGDYCGSDNFTYTIRDSGSLTASGSIQVEIACLNDPPQAHNDTGVTLEDTPLVLNLLANDLDVDGNLDPASLALQEPPGFGAAQVGAGGWLTYTPAADFFGSDLLTYQVCDDLAVCASASLSLEIQPVNDPPHAVPDEAAGFEDITLEIQVLANDLAGPPNENQALTLVSLSAAQHGSAEIGSANQVIYHPALNYCGADSLIYTLADSGGLTASAVLELTLACVNDAPEPFPDGYVLSRQTAQDGNQLVIPAVVGVLQNDQDVDSPGALTASLVDLPQTGELSLLPDGSFTFTFTGAASSTDFFLYQVSDGDLSAQSSVTLTIDLVAPGIAWQLPVQNNGIYYTTGAPGEIIPLQTLATDDWQVARVRYIRWDPASSAWIDLGNQTASPHRLDYPAAGLLPYWNELRAVVYDHVGNFTLAERILIYHTPPLYLPLTRR